jgi:SAM-dependent methyltransferase
MRATPFADGEFASVVCVHAIEHVADPERVAAEAARVLQPGGTAVVVTPNRLTFARADEIVDPYHEVELDPRELRAVCATAFGTVELQGLFGSPRYRAFVARELAAMDRVLDLDRLRLRRHVPNRARRVLYDAALRAARLRRAHPDAIAIGVEDFDVRTEGLDGCLDVIAVCRDPR